MASYRPTIYMIAGPNGAGKSTFYETVIATKIGAPFINADVIQKQELEDQTVEGAYEASRIAASRRQEFIQQKKSFVTESVFSHPSKLELLNDAAKVGYYIMLFHIHTQSPELSVARVAERVKEGGHDVPEKKIRERYKRNQSLIKHAALLADKAFIYDGSALNKSPTLLITLSNGMVDRAAEQIPMWTRRMYRKELAVYERLG